MRERSLAGAIPIALALLTFGLACGGLPFGSEPIVEDRPPESPLTWGLLMSWAALFIGGGSAVIGIWVDRDKTRPVMFAVSMSVLIMAALGVGALQGYLDEEGAIETRANLERMLDMVEDIAAESGDPELSGLVTRNGKHRRPRSKAKAGGGAGDGEVGKAGKGEKAGKAGKAEPTQPAPTEPAPTEPAPTEPAPAPEPAEGGAPAGKTGKGNKAKGGG